MEQTNFTAINSVLIMGVLFDKKRNANNVDIKRPVLDFQVLFVDEKGVPFIETLPALFSDKYMARGLNSYNIGEVFLLSGALRCDETLDAGMYLEVKSITRVGERNKNNEENALFNGKTKLLTFQAPNQATISGIVTKTEGNMAWISSERKDLCAGDLKRSDSICLFVNTKLEPGMKLIVTGPVCGSYMRAETETIIS